MKRIRNNNSTQITKSTFDGYFPAEIFMEVFFKLPVKSLLRFRCVSKTWRDLIDSPDFISKHMIHYNTSSKNNDDNENYCEILTFQFEGRQKLCFTTRRSDTFKKLAPLVNIPDQDRPRASIDGLILLLDISRNGLRLWNPSIRKSLLLPRCELLWRSGPSFALGFSPSSNAYKVYVFDFRSIGLEFAVYGLNDGCWRISSRGMDMVDWSRLKVDSECLSTTEAAYWLAGYIHDPWSRECYTHIVSFDFDVEDFSFVKLPDEGSDMMWFLFLLGGSVAILGISHGSTCIWVMDKVRGNYPWNKWYSGDSSSDVYDYFLCWLKSSSHGKLLYVKKSGLFLMHVDGEQISYNIRSREIHHLAKSVASLMCMYTHVETLAIARRFGGTNFDMFSMK